MSWYKLAKSFLFQLQPEQAHHVTMRLLKIAQSNVFSNALVNTNIENEQKLSKNISGLNFPNPIGIAAGFDKNALYIGQMEKLGFGYVEIGTVTPKPQEGNPKPRLFRLEKDAALINRMGFNNHGADVVAERLSKIKTNVIIGGNIGKNKATPNNEAVNDYVYCFEKLFNFVHYFVVNVSSPNTPNLRQLQDKEALNQILGTLQNLNEQKPQQKPIFLKIAPDLTENQLDEIVEIVQQTKIAGIIATNTTISRSGLKTPAKVVENVGAGGLSGAPLQQKSMEILQYLRPRLPKNIAIISSGGIMTAAEAVKRLEAGADLLQLYTGFIYEGPQLLKEIKLTLVQKLS